MDEKEFEKLNERFNTLYGLSMVLTISILPLLLLYLAFNPQIIALFCIILAIAAFCDIYAIVCFIQKRKYFKNPVNKTGENTVSTAEIENDSVQKENSIEKNKIDGIESEEESEIDDLNKN